MNPHPRTLLLQPGSEAGRPGEGGGGPGTPGLLAADRRRKSVRPSLESSTAVHPIIRGTISRATAAESAKIEQTVGLCPPQLQVHSHSQHAPAADPEYFRLLNELSGFLASQQITEVSYRQAFEFPTCPISRESLFPVIPTLLLSEGKMAAIFYTSVSVSARRPDESNSSVPQIAVVVRKLLKTHH